MPDCNPVSISNELKASIEEVEMDRFNLSRIVVSESDTDFIDIVIAELLNCGVYKTTYAELSLRAKLFGEGDRPPDRHAAHASRAGAPARV